MNQRHCSWGWRGKQGRDWRPGALGPGGNDGLKKMLLMVSQSDPNAQLNLSTSKSALCTFWLTVVMAVSSQRQR